MDTDYLVFFVVTANAAVLVLGGSIAALAYRAYRRNRPPAMKRFDVGFAAITLGFLFDGALHLLVGRHVLVGVLVQSSFAGVGFAVLAYSLYADESRRDRGRDDAGN